MKFKTNQSEFLKFLEDTWPPEQVIHFDDWTIRISDGAGKRASAISLEGTWGENSFRKLKDLLKKFWIVLFLISLTSCVTPIIESNIAV